MTAPVPPADVAAEEVPVQIEVTIALDLSAREVWPDGVPGTWDAAAVMKEILKSRTAERFIEDWDLLTFGAEVRVYAKGQDARGELR